MKKIIIAILSLFLCICTTQATVIEYIYSDWFDYYPEGINEARIDSEDRYRWYKIENDERIETEEYYNYLEGYEKIEESKKTYYRVINSDYIIIDVDGKLVHDHEECRKVFCYKIRVQPFTPEEPSEPEEPIEIVNPDTSDPLYMYYYSFIISLFVLISCGIIYLVLSKRWK